MKTMKTVMMLAALLVIAANAHAAVRTVKGLWVTTTDDRLYWLRLQASNGATTALVEELTGTITAASVGGSAESTSEAEVTGQYLVRTGIVVLNIGKPGPTWLIGASTDGFVLLWRWLVERAQGDSPE